MIKAQENTAGPEGLEVLREEGFALRNQLARLDFTEVKRRLEGGCEV